MFEESGVGILNPLFFMGIVENNVDPRLEGRVQVRAFNIYGTKDEVPTEDLPWAVCVQGSYEFGAKPPAINSFVFGFFIDGRSAQQPMLLGVIPTQMTQFVQPGMGYGSTPVDMKVSAQGSRPEDFGEPSMPKTSRGERLEDTHVYAMEANRVTEVKMPTDYDSNAAWSEPGSAYAAKYPYNWVKESASGHVIEVDDTPGAERILIFHRSGAYIQIDSGGGTSTKTMGDKYDINEENCHVYIGGKSMITVEGDATMYVGGSLTSEVMGNLNMNVHGDYNLNVAGTSTHVSGDAIKQKASAVYSEASGAEYSIVAGSDVIIDGGGAVSVKSGDDMSMGAGGVVSVNAGGNVAIDGSEVHLNSGMSEPVDSVGKMPFPAPQSKSTSINKHDNPSNMPPKGTLSWNSSDDTGEMA